jgi:hypothetical protein
MARVSHAQVVSQQQQQAAGAVGRLLLNMSALSVEPHYSVRAVEQLGIKLLQQQD